MGERKVLIVDDDADLRELLCLLFSDAGYRVAGAADGEEALREVEREMPAAILLDMKMPVMDGAQFERAFRDRYGRGGAAIVVVTAAVDARRCAEEVGAEAYLAKPFALDEALAVVERLVGPAHAPTPSTSP